MKIFYQYSKRKVLEPNRGDTITEVNTIKAFEQFADVTYGGDPEGDYDICFVRGNPELFKQLPHPKVYFASLYDEAAYAEADYVYTFTDEWTDRLKHGRYIPYMPRGLQKDKVVTVHQTLPPRFKPLQDHERTKQLRDSWGGNFIIGHFGSVRESHFPHSFLHILPALKLRYPNLTVIFSDLEGLRNVKIESDHIYTSVFPYEDMPYAINACNLLLYNLRDDQGHVAGSMKILESMACGTPILSPRFKPREFELGKDYEMFHDFEMNNGRYSPRIEKQMYDLICKLIDDEKLQKSISKKLIRRAKYFSLKESAKRLEKMCKRIIADYKKHPIKKKVVAPVIVTEPQKGFSNKRVFVTGASRGIGKVIAEAFVEAGATVHTINSTEDVRNPQNFKAMDFDILINNAGNFEDALCHKMEDNTWKKVIDVNLTGTFNLTRAALPYMREKGYGRIINITSVQGQTGVMGASNYAAAKAGVIGLTKSIAKENATKGITVNAIALGFIDIGMFHRLDKKLQQKIIGQIPMKRTGTPAEVVSLTLYLASEEAAYITGQTINLNGGYYLG